MSSGMARHEHADVRMAFDAEGRILAAGMDHVQNVGAYPTPSPLTAGVVVGMLFRTVTARPSTDAASGPRWWLGRGPARWRRHSMTDVEIRVRINGATRHERIPPRLTLADYLRERCGLTGTHLGCEHGVCGACTVLFDGEAVRACLIFAVQADGAELTTIEGIAASDGELSPVQAAFRDQHGLQCGFCTPGFIVSATAFLRENPSPSDEEIREAISGNLCRCTGYQGIVRAVQAASGGAGRHRPRVRDPSRRTTTPCENDPARISLYCEGTAVSIDDAPVDQDRKPPRIDFDRHTPEYRHRFEEITEEFHARCPLAWTDTYGGHWVAGGSDEVFEFARSANVSNDHDVHGTRRGYKGISIPTARRAAMVRGGILEMDDPEHRIYRQVLNPYLSPAAVKRCTHRSTRRRTRRTPSGSPRCIARWASTCCRISPRSRRTRALDSSTGSSGCASTANRRPISNCSACSAC